MFDFPVMGRQSCSKKTLLRSAEMCAQCKESVDGWLIDLMNFRKIGQVARPLGPAQNAATGGWNLPVSLLPNGRSSSLPQLLRTLGVRKMWRSL